jgi:hypothetical protein
MRSHYLCSSTDKGEDALASLRVHGYVEAIWGHTGLGRMLMVPHPDAYVERVDQLVYKTDPGAQCVQSAIAPTVSHLRRVTSVPEPR